MSAKRNARGQAGVDVGTGKQASSESTSLSVSAQLGWAVVVNGRKTSQTWGRYCSRAGALAVARQLHARGIEARVIEAAP